MKKITVIIPCYNEEAGIADVIGGFPEEALRQHGYDLEVLVIDNNSTDRTADVARAAGARVIFEGKQGKGHAIRAGFYNISPDTDYVVMLDGDHTYEPAEILRLIEPLAAGFSNVIIGSRLGGRIAGGSMKRFNRMGNWIYSHLVRYAYRVNVTDVLTGYFAWTRPAVEKLRPHLTSPGFAIEMEMITKLARLGESIYSVPISYHARAGSSSLRPIRDGLRILRMFMHNLMWRAKPPHTRRIAFVSDAVFPYNHGGKERRLYEVSRRLADTDHEIHIYTMQWWKGPRVIQHQGVYLHAICRLYPLYDGERRSTREAVMFGLATFRLLFERFDALDVDSMPFFPLFSARIVAWLRRRPLYATWHEVTGRAGWQAYLGRRPASLIAWWVEWLSMRSADTLISVSKQTTHRLRGAGVTKPILTVPLGVDLQGIYKIRASRAKSDVIYVGRLVAHKNIDLLLYAVARLKTDHPHIVVKIVGNGPEKPRLTRLISELGLEANVTMVGIVDSDSKLYSLMKASRMFVLPSIREGFSVVAVEANAAGIPVITTNHPDNAARDRVTDGVNGYVVEPTAAGLADGISTVLTRTDKMKTAQDLSQYDWDLVAENIKKVLVT